MNLGLTWWAPRVWAVVLSVVLLGPALGPGFVLSYDMVWVPELTLRSDFLGLGAGLPRAVPSDAVVAVVDTVLPGMLLQRVVLLGLLVGAGWGAVRLAPAGSLAGQLAAVSVYLWNPFVAERLAIGHWPVLVGYAVLPWILVSVGRGNSSGAASKRSDRLPTRLWLLVPLGSLSASAGVATAVALVAAQVRRQAPRRALAVALLLVAANAPWVVAGLLHSADATTGEAAVRVFGLAGVDDVPAWAAALGLGGTWNAEVVLPSRTATTVLLALVVFGALAAAGARTWWRRPDAAALVACWVVGWVLAVLTWALPEATAWVMQRVPGVAVLRDGGRLLALCAPLVASLVAYGAAAVARRAPNRAATAALTAAAVLAPLALLPDAGWGLSGRLRSVDYPSAYDEARAAVERRSTQVDGDVAILPFTSYRAPDWNGGRKVLDPLGRYLPEDFVANDELSVSGRPIPGEDPRARSVAAALGRSTPEERSRALADVGIRWVVVNREAPGRVPDVSGDRVLATDRIDVVELDDVAPRAVPTSWLWAMGAAWVAFVTLLAWGAARLAFRAFRHLGSG